MDPLQDNELYCIAKCDIHEGADGIAHVASHTFSSMSEHPGKRDDSNGIHREYDVAIRTREMDGDTNRYKDQQDIEPS